METNSVWLAAYNEQLSPHVQCQTAEDGQIWSGCDTDGFSAYNVNSCAATPLNGTGVLFNGGAAYRKEDGFVLFRHANGMWMVAHDAAPHLRPHQALASLLQSVGISCGLQSAPSAAQVWNQTKSLQWWNQARRSFDQFLKTHGRVRCTDFLTKAQAHDKAGRMFYNGPREEEEEEDEEEWIPQPSETS